MKWKDWKELTPEQRKAYWEAYKKEWLATHNSILPLSS